MKTDPDPVLETIAKLFASRASQLEAEDAGIYYHNGELSHVSIGDRCFFFYNGEWYEVIEVGDLT